MCAIAALPAAADAATVKLEFDGTRATFEGTGGEDNEAALYIRDANTIEVTDAKARVVPGAGCSQITADRIRCHSFGGITHADVRLGEGNDSFRVLDGADRGEFHIGASGGAGNDTYVGGVTPERTSVIWRGGDGFDRAMWTQSDRPVRVVKDFVTGDGRQGLDDDFVSEDTERIIGSRFNDTLVGSDDPGRHDELEGGPGNDTVEGRRGFELFLSDATRDGADRFDGGSDGAAITYQRRTAPISAVINDGFANDGEAGEGDNLKQIHRIVGGSSGDTLLAAGAVSGKVTEMFGGNGADSLFGTNGADLLTGDDGADRLLGNGGGDTLAHFSSAGDADDGDVDTVDGGTGFDIGVVGRGDRANAIEFSRVGTVRARASGDRLAVSWTHPRAWRQLRSIRMSLRDERGAQLGEITVHPRRGTVRRRGIEARVRLTREGRTVVARVRLRPGAALEGRRVTLDVEAVDVRGRRQVAPAATSLRLPS